MMHNNHHQLSTTGAHHHHHHLSNHHHNHHNLSSSSGSSSSYNNNSIMNLMSRNLSGSIESSENNNPFAFCHSSDPDHEDLVASVATTTTDDDDLPETLTSFVADLGGVIAGDDEVDDAEVDCGYGSVDLFCSSSQTTMIDCCGSVDLSPEAYYLRLALEQQQQQHHQQHNHFHHGQHHHPLHLHNSHYNHHNYHQQQDISNGNNRSNNNNNCDAADTNGAKRSVLMNLLINGSDVSAGYTIHNSCKIQH